MCVGIIQSVEGLYGTKSWKKEELISACIIAWAGTLILFCPWCSWYSGFQTWTELHHWLSWVSSMQTADCVTSQPSHNRNHFLKLHTHTHTHTHTPSYWSCLSGEPWLIKEGIYKGLQNCRGGCYFTWRDLGKLRRWNLQDVCEPWLVWLSGLSASLQT